MFKKLLAMLFVGTMVVSVGMHTAFSAEPYPQNGNLVANGDFSNGLDSWDYTHNPGSVPSAEVVYDDTYCGGKAVKFLPDNGWGHTLAGTFPVTLGETYEVYCRIAYAGYDWDSALFLLSNSDQKQILSYVGAADNYLVSNDGDGINNKVSLTKGTAWYTYNFQFTANNTENYRFVVHGGGADSTVYLNSLVVRKLGTDYAVQLANDSAVQTVYSSSYELSGRMFKSGSVTVKLGEETVDVINNVTDYFKLNQPLTLTPGENTITVIADDGESRTNSVVPRTITVNYDQSKQSLTKNVPPANVVTNGSFEVVSGNPLTPAGWTIPAGGGIRKAADDADNVHTGSYSVEVGGGGWHSANYDLSALKPATDYRLSFWVKLLNNDGWDCNAFMSFTSKTQSSGGIYTTRMKLNGAWDDEVEAWTDPYAPTGVGSHMFIPGYFQGGGPWTWKKLTLDFNTDEACFENTAEPVPVSSIDFQSLKLYFQTGDNSVYLLDDVVIEEKSKPVISVNQYDNGHFPVGDEYILTGKVTANTTSLTATVDGVSVNSGDITLNSDGTYAIKLDGQEGEYDIEITAVNKYGNETVSFKLYSAYEFKITNMQTNLDNVTLTFKSNVSGTLFAVLAYYDGGQLKAVSIGDLNNVEENGEYPIIFGNINPSELVNYEVKVFMWKDTGDMQPYHTSELP